MRLASRWWLAFSIALTPATASAQPPIDIAWTEITPEWALTTDGNFGGNSAFDGATLLVSGAGRIAVYEWDGEALSFVQELDPGPEDHPGFGWEAFGVLGDLIVVTDARAESERGAVSFYERDAAGVWSRTRRDVGSCCDNGILAADVDIEGGRIAMGAPYYGGGFGTMLLLRADASGDFAYTTTRFSRFTPIIGNLAGFGVSIEGDRIAFGSLGGFTAPADAGGVFVLEDTGTALREDFRIDNPTPNVNDQFGIGVHMDARIIAVAARYDDEVGRDSGAVHVFDRAGTLQQSLIGPEAYARFGAHFDVDGDWMLVGAPAFIPPGVTGETAHPGSIFVYQRDADGEWRSRGRTFQSGMPTGTHFGVRTEIVGNVIYVGANTARVGGVANAGRAWIGVLTEQNGQPCASDEWCGSGSCVDGICCESACDGACEACAEALTGQDDGTCAPITDGTDPDAECADGCSPGVCMDGACAPVAACDAGTLDAGIADGGLLDGGSLDGGGSDGGAERDAAPMVDGAISPDAPRIDAAGSDAAASDVGPAVPRVPLSCTCRAGGRGGPSLPLIATMALLAALLHRRR